jgi:osmotically-inducible protein OsmY
MKTDAQLQQDVIAELKWEPSVTSTDIGVEVKHGVVTLAGHVENFSEKWHAELAAQRVSGVRAVAVEIDVKLAAWGSKRTDSEIAQSAANALQWQVYLSDVDAVKVIVAKGWVTLSGTVEWDYQRTTAEAAVRYLVGVIGVSNNIIIKTTVSPMAVKADIEAALKRRAANEAHNILVVVDGGNVTLSGKVLTWTERDLARQAAWGTPGVKEVTDNLNVSSI